jgi:hypothetical protein
MNIAFVGCGQIACRFQAPAFAALKDEGWLCGGRTGFHFAILPLVL